MQLYYHKSPDVRDSSSITMTTISKAMAALLRRHAREVAELAEQERRADQ